jgi:hypothetical protein
MVGGSGRLELGRLLRDLCVGVLVSSRDDERDGLGAEVAAADEPLVSLKDEVASRPGVLVLGLLPVVGSGC